LFGKFVKAHFSKRGPGMQSDGQPKGARSYDGISQQEPQNKNGHKTAADQEWKRFGFKDEPPAPSDARWTKVSVQLPTSPTLFPAGQGADIANSQCVICHSPDMVLYQPARTQEQWKETINKMRSAYGAPLPAEQVDALATYLAQLKP